MVPPEMRRGPWIVANTYEQGGFRVAALTGEIDVATAPQLRTLLMAQLDPPPHYVVVDVTAVTFADSSALGAIVAAWRKAGLLGGILRVAVPVGHRVARTLGLVGLDRVFEVYRDVEEAVTMPVVPAARWLDED